ncbi:MAG TPA: tetratricopeptide repeat protein [Gemmatimonadales bacterium]|jgi:tetratricopeptide (TPR) repeat protein|nr:tetratricopeptide repeat protein [Gemmatimonadales bacterium]
MSLPSRWVGWGALLALGACGPAGGAEGVGDQSYADGRYQEALAAYAPLAETAPSPRLWAKIGASALHLGQLSEATAAYRALGTMDPTRADEAAEGLERVILAAERRLDDLALEEAVKALRAVAPDRPLGRHALSLMKVADGPVSTSDLAAAIAAATEAGTIDTLLVRQAAALAGADSCASAVPLFQSALRRSGREGNPSAEGGLVGCFFRLGSAQLAYAPDSAEAWFREAAGVDSTTGVGRAAMIGLGDARARQGDLVGAALAYQSALSSGPRTDSLGVLAGAKLNALVSAVPPDSLSTGQP